MLKRELAEMLADDEYSVKAGITPRTYWINRYMERRKADLVALLERKTTPAS